MSIICSPLPKLGSNNLKARQMKSKYGNRKVTIDNITFDSAAEAARYQELKLLEKAGEIESLSVHPSFVLLKPFTDGRGRKHQGIIYEGDFSYFEKKHQPFTCMDKSIRIVEDVKGMETAVFKLKAKMFIHNYRAHELRIIKA